MSGGMEDTAKYNENLDEDFEYYDLENQVGQAVIDLILLINKAVKLKSKLEE